MTITLSPDLEAALQEHARRRGVSPETLALNALREKFTSPTPPIVARDEWERLVLETGSDCGTSVPHEALSSEGLYE
jgi:predicted transcriptional regulator